MFQKILLGMLTLFMMMTFQSHADKIDKKGTILNANCRPIGTKCKASLQTEINYTYLYNEPRPGSLSIQINENEATKIATLLSALKGRYTFTLEEPIQIPGDVIAALHMPSNYIIPPGSYTIRFQNNIYSIIFKE